MTRLLRTPAADRLDWILAGLDGASGWGADAASVLAPEFAAIVPPPVYVERVHRRSRSYAPVAVVGIDITDHTAKARLRRPGGEVDVLSCKVEPQPPHRIVMTWVLGVVPAGLTPRLPMDFETFDAFDAFDAADALDASARADKQSLIVFSGLPGSGKSTLADATGRELGVPVFAIDWLLGALTPFGGRHFADLHDIGVEQLTTLAVRQLALGQSAILDAPVEDLASRARWRSLAQRADASFKVIVCVCSDSAVHRARVEGRTRDIPGWHTAGDWTNVSRRLAAFEPWDREHLEVDTLEPHRDNLAAVLRYLSS